MSPVTRLFFIHALRQDKILMKHRKITNSGFTLPEIILTIAILGLISAAIVPFIRSVSSTWNIGSRKTELQQNARSSLDIMLRMLRQARRITQVSASGSGDFVKFRDANELYTIVFYHNVASSPFYIGNSGLMREGDLVMRSISDTGSSDALLARNLESFQIDFKDKNGLITSKPQAVSSLNISMLLKDSLNNETISLSSVIFLRSDLRITKPVWVAAGDFVYELLNDIKVSGFSHPKSVSVNLATGECWVADTGNNRIKKISAQGSIILDIAGFNNPSGVSVNRQTGECWVADTGNNRVLKLSNQGNVIRQIGSLDNPVALSVNNVTSNCWVVEAGTKKKEGRIKKISSDGDIILDINKFSNNNQKISFPSAVSAAYSDDSCWFSDAGNNRVKKVSSPGLLLLAIGAKSAQGISVNSKDGSCWIADTGNNRIRKISDSGSSLATIKGLQQPAAVWVDSVDGFCWAVDTDNNQLVRINEAGQEELRINLTNSPLSVAGFENE